MPTTIVALNKANASGRQRQFHAVDANHTVGKLRKVATDTAKEKQFELWQLETCDLRIKAWGARDIQLQVRVGAKRECLPKLGARLKHDRIDDDAEDERNKEGLRDCLSPQAAPRKPWSISVDETNRA